MRKYLLPFLLLFLSGVAIAAPSVRYDRTILPESDQTYELGTSTKQWLRIGTKELCLDGTCQTAWPASNPFNQWLDSTSTPTFGGLIVSGNATTTGNHNFNTVTGISLDEIDSPATDKTFTMAGNNLTFNFTTPSDGLTLNAIGAFNDHVLHVHQSTGNPPAGTQLTHLHAEDSDVLPLYVEGTASTTAFFTGGRVQMNGGASTTNFTATGISNLANVLVTDRLGIGTTSPYAKLSVVGEVVGEKFTATSSNATSSFTNMTVSGNLVLGSQYLASLLPGYGSSATRLAAVCANGRTWYDTTLDYLTVCHNGNWVRWDGVRLESTIVTNTTNFASSTYNPGNTLVIKQTFTGLISAATSSIVFNTSTSTITLYATSTSATNTIEYKYLADYATLYTIPNLDNTYSIPAQTLGGNIKENGTTLAIASKAISSTQASNAGTRTITASADSPADIQSVVWDCSSGTTTQTLPNVRSNSLDDHCFVVVRYNKNVDVTVGASINVVENQDGSYSQKTIYAAAQTNVREAKFKYENSGATTLYTLSHGASIGYDYTACANGSDDNDVDFPYTISGTIVNTGSAIAADKVIGSSSEFPYYRINDGY